MVNSETETALSWDGVEAPPLHNNSKALGFTSLTQWGVGDTFGRFQPSFGLVNAERPSPFARPRRGVEARLQANRPA
jgi:hypothetical protein